MKPPVITTRPQAAIFGQAIEPLNLPFHANPWTSHYALTMHDLGQLNHAIQDDWHKRWDDVQREAVNAIYFSLRIEGSS